MFVWLGAWSPGFWILEFGIWKDLGLWRFCNATCIRDLDLGILEFGISGRGELSGALGSGFWNLEFGSLGCRRFVRVRIRVRLGL